MIKINRVEGVTDLYCKYQGQMNPQPVYVELDPQREELSASYNAEIGNAVPMTVWHGTVIRWQVSCVPTAEAMNRELETLLPLFERFIAGHSTKWDGSNFVGRQTDDAADVALQIDNHLQECFDFEDQVIAWDAGDWLQNNSDEELGITKEMTEDDFDKLVESLQEDAKDEGIHVLEGLEDEIHYRLFALRAEIV